MKVCSNCGVLAAKHKRICEGCGGGRPFRDDATGRIFKPRNVWRSLTVAEQAEYDAKVERARVALETLMGHV